MSDRRYTVAEIDALRRAVANKYLWGFYSGPPEATHYSSRNFKEADMEKIVEERVRTHMLAGHTAEELTASDNDQRIEHGRLLDEMNERATPPALPK